jgi:hypothetical protein
MVNARICLAVLLIGAIALHSAPAARADTYIGLTKQQLVRRLGLPAEIELRTRSGPAKEIWIYYWEHPTRGLESADFQFTGNTVSGFVSEFDAKRIVSTESSAGFERVYRYVVERERNRSPR